MEYEEDDFLQLSGVQHFVFCRRQWALIHIENQWRENAKTVDGAFFHQRVHDETSRERRGNLIIDRGVSIHSRALGLSGQCDVIEFHKTEAGVPLRGEIGKWLPYPVEYKRGRAKITHCDEVQVCAQAMCLEEMYACDLKEAALFYGENRRRQLVELSEQLRDEVISAVEEMHDLSKKNYTPKVKKKKCCYACSLHENCMPELQEKESVGTYLTRICGDN
ncbi:CRISPR-associated protein Cas4 [Shuttleworthella satelles]|uniref:CRISPR-associated exonuclease Cas4 n=1 Tax=Shuttleworthella satelles DSM 14600 TaxID=626523 RepID=C4G805_9FIRM|nr:CRISPR-associated protein Cas4 [Shuttleworthia satelles]EEP28829.1 CRISPR-associated protein Cas4 [Shuttleworthia satelles DSM 14600]